MSALDKLRDRAMQQGMKLMSDPRFIKLMSHPQAQRVMSLAFQLPGSIEAAFASQGKKIAHRFKLATHEEVEQLNATVRELEYALAESQSSQAGEANHSAAPKPARSSRTRRHD